MGTTTTTVIIYDDMAVIFAATCACVFSVIGIIGNLVTIIALLLNPKLRGHATTAFVLSLCISDLVFCAFSLPLTAVRYINKAWIMGDQLCKIFPVIFYSNVAFSLLSMVGITLNRYILIAYNNLYSKIYKPINIGFQLLFIWIFSLSIMIPPYLGIWGEVGLHEATFSCTILQKDGRSIKKFLFVVGFLIPCIVIILSYSCIYWIVRKQRQKLFITRTVITTAATAAAATTTATNTTTINGSEKIKNNNKNKKKSSASNRRGRDREDSRLTSMMLIIFLCFLMCFLPLMLVNVAINENRYPWLHICASILAWASSVINPFIYAASNRTYRVAYYKLFAIARCANSSSIISNTFGGPQSQHQQNQQQNHQQQQQHQKHSTSQDLYKNNYSSPIGSQQQQQQRPQQHQQYFNNQNSSQLPIDCGTISLTGCKSEHFLLPINQLPPPPSSSSFTSTSSEL